MEIQVSAPFFRQLYQFNTVYYPHLVDTFAVWIVVDYPEEEVMPAAMWGFLEKILGALRLRRQDVRVSNVGKDGWQDYSQSSSITYRFMWSFGVELPDLPALTPYEPRFVGEVSCLRIDTLDILSQNLDLKKKFWGVLQKMFNP